MSKLATIGLDVGTQSTKCIIYDPINKSILARSSSSPHQFTSDSSSQATKKEQDPKMWIDACKQAISKALSQINHGSTIKIKAISVSGQQHGLVVLDNNDAVIRPAKLWCDIESAPEAHYLSDLFNTTIVPSYTITKLLWLKNNEPDNYNRVRNILLPHDYINFWLTGIYSMEASDASGTGFFDPVTRQWDMERIKAIDENIIDFLPSKITQSTEIAGTMLPSVAAELGIDISNNGDIYVGAGGGDNAMSALGCAAVDQGCLVLSLGTSGTLFGPAKKVVLDDTGTICSFCDATDQALPLLCTINCTGATEEIKNMINNEANKTPETHETLAEFAQREPPGCHGVTFLPYLDGERTPNWPHATGALLNLRPGLLRPGILYRAAMEGATFSLLHGLHLMQHAATEICVVGGGSKNKVWRRIIADSFGVPLRFPAETETAALGAAFQAAFVGVYKGKTTTSMVTGKSDEKEEEEFRNFVKEHAAVFDSGDGDRSGVIYPDESVKSAYEDAYERFVRLGERLFATSS